MNNKRLIIVVLVSMLIVWAWSMGNRWVRQSHPEWFAQDQGAQPQPQTQPEASTQAAPGTTPTTLAAATQTATTPAAIAPGQINVEPPTRPGTATLGHTALDPKGDAAYPLGVKLQARGASLEAVVVNRSRKDVDKDEPYTFQMPYEGADAGYKDALAARTLIVNGQHVDLANIAWNLLSSDANTATFAATIRSGEQPLLVIEKQFVLPDKNQPNSGYELAVRYTFRNATAQPVGAKLIFNGPNVPQVETTRDIPELVIGYDGGEQTVILEHFPATTYEFGKGETGLADSKGRPILWAGFASAYFDGILRSAALPNQGITIAQATAAAVKETNKESGQPFTALTFTTNDFSVPAIGTASVGFDVYLGPRQRAVLTNAHYDPYPRDYDETLVLTSGPCGWCTFPKLINMLVWMLKGFFIVTRDWGLAIICLVILVRLLLHPITKRSQISMSKMGKMGPELERLKKKYGDNKEELNKAMMGFYREQGFTPILGCLPMLLQMPIWIALWSALQSTFELRHAAFLGPLTWIDDLAQPDRLMRFTPVSFFFIYFDALNVLPILLAGVFWLQQKYTPKPPAMTPEQEQQQKMMQWMTLLFPLLLYNGPSGLNLYILTSTSIGIWESKRVRAHLKELEEKEKAGPTIVEDEPRRRDDLPAPGKVARSASKEAAPKTGLGGWMAKLQAKAEEMQREAEKRGKGKKR